ncbi:hypothetical protein CHGG_10650 [Chaetomium globosum CBS 148.51]|uniref:Xylanolytic transcriptional activator regulatory domain-containing protein n=1 Tax=Chaetomium globosum (strain ATCC 6205 / CBS 148.51 / DSM 1962 / NBRC 6347 / NRRL 1970) TaxID=306901 RepID=Q2GN04_CHAGB|nr:uncharacterized protein CHGG_10650 [Chaetomium globosum CBS 148.51]EAQ84246.1 hypothetical protein CHGG_10650 [Chaetomium globosum CBS 148.51]
MALVRKLAPEDDRADLKDKPVPSEVEAQVRKTLEMMPSRRIIDFLVRYFVTEVNHLDQLLYPPWFLGQYQRWWELYSVSTVAEIEFLILILRICCYASQFLPSPSYTIDSIKGVPLTQIRKSCEDVIYVLGPICSRLYPRGSLVRVQQIAYGGLAAGSIGHMNSFWEMISCASRVAQHIGLHLDAVISASSADEMDKEMTRRTYCNLYIWDSYLARHLDRIPFLPDTLNADILPRMRLLPDSIGIDSETSDVPNVFTERILRARLAEFWRCHRLPRSPEWDVIAAEEVYEEFCSTFLQTMPPAFALEPDTQWDEHLPTLVLQRQLLHIAIFEQLCWNFKPTVLQQPDQVTRLPLYKQVMMAHGKRALAAAALRLLQCVSTLHRLMGGSHTRFSGIIVPTFEAAVPLLCLCADPTFPGDTIQHGPGPGGMGMGMGMGGGRRSANPLEARIGKVTRGECVQAARDALAMLEALSEVSEVAEVGAKTLARLITRVDGLTLTPPMSVSPQEVYGGGGAGAGGEGGVNVNVSGGDHLGGGPGGGGDMAGSISAGGVGAWPMRECVPGGGAGAGVQQAFPFVGSMCAGVSPGWADLLGDLTDSFGI